MPDVEEEQNFAYRFGQKMSKNSAKVIVIGAGLSGLSCADTLVQGGVDDILVLEATDRTGGRICSVDLGDNGLKAEMGAQFIHGIEHNPIYQIAEQNNLLKLRNCDNHFKDKKKVMTVTETGETVPLGAVKEVDWDFGMLIQKAEDFYHDQASMPHYTKNVGEFIKHEFESEHLKKVLDPHLRHLHHLIFDQRLQRECYLCGCSSLEQVDLSNFGSYEELPGVHYVIPAGFEEVVNVMRTSVPKDRVLFNHAVRKVSWNVTDGSAVKEGNDSEDQDRSVCIECENGAKFTADHVVFTCSLGFLKQRARSMFSPALPEAKLKAIQNLGFGTVNKMMLVFEEPVLDKSVKRIELLWDRGESEGGAGEEGETAWTRNISSIDALSDTAIQMNVTGVNAEHMESLSDEEVVEALLQVLRKFLAKDIPQPKKLLRSCWHSNEWQHGAYSFVQVGSGVEDVHALAQPLYTAAGAALEEKPVVQFAGEATHASFYSTSHGALLSGQREAKRLLAYIGGIPFEEEEEKDELEDTYQGFMF